MSAYSLQCALRGFLTSELAKLPLLSKSRPGRDNDPEAKKEFCRPAKIYIGDVAPNQPRPAEAVPFVCLQERGGHDAEGMSRVELVIRCAVYSREPIDAAHELANLVGVIRHALIKARLLENKYRLLTDNKGRLLPWKTPTGQNHPYAESWILSVWEYKSIE